MTIDDIKRRHEMSDRTPTLWPPDVAHRDRAWLLAEVERLAAALAELRTGLVAWRTRADALLAERDEANYAASEAERRAEAAERRASTWKRAAKDWRAARNVARAGHHCTQEAWAREAAAFDAAEQQSAQRFARATAAAEAAEAQAAAMREALTGAIADLRAHECVHADAYDAALSPDAGSRVLGRLAAAEARCAELGRALAFYADASTYSRGWSEFHGEATGAKIDGDQGKRARSAISAGPSPEARKGGG